jgi:hypothetical protein
MLTLDLKADGMKAVQKQLSYLERITSGKVYRTAELMAKKREDGDEFSAKILEYLADQGRDFRDIDKGETEKVAEAFLDQIMTRFHTVSAKTGEQRAALNASNKGFRDAMLKLMEHVSKHINDAKWTGGGSKKLSENYARIKEARHGFRYPIGKATGQLLDALNPKGPASRNIRIKRK